MSDHNKTREQLLDELQTLRQLFSESQRVIAENARRVAALQESANRFQIFMDNSPTAAFIKDEDGHYLYVSATARRYMASDPETYPGKTDFDLFPTHTAQQFRDNDASVLAAGKLRELIETLPGSNGEPRHFLTFKFPFRDGSGTLLLGGMAVDITLRKLSEDRQNQDAERLQALSRRLVEVQEEERRRLAGELHDEIGQALTNLRFTLEAVGEAAGSAASARLDEARTLIEEILRQVRALSFDLRPALLDHLGLLAALPWLLERFTARTRIQVHFKHAGLEVRLPPEVETTAYRIVQEALTNVARHAGIQEMAVRICVNAGVLELQIEDQGVGFEVETVLAAGRSSGLPGMIERVKLLGGQLTITSTPGSGTHLLALLPLDGTPGRKIEEHFHRLDR